MYDPELPFPPTKDIDPYRPTTEPAWWECRFCGFREEGPLTVKAEVQRSMAHECRCSKRPPDDIPTQYEEHCFTAVHTAGLQHQLLPLVTALALRRAELAETASYCFMTFRGFRARRALRTEITVLQSTIDEIHQRAKDLGLSEGWNTSPPGVR